MIVGLACVWYFSARDGDSGLLGPLYTDEADPGTRTFMPRPDWYFYFLFYLLRIFKWPDSVILGTVGIPTICIVLLLALPFLDRRMERRLSRRPVAIVAALLVIASMGDPHVQGRDGARGGLRERRGAARRERDRDRRPEVIAGANIFGVAGCLNCHTYGNQGAAGPGPEPLRRSARSAAATSTGSSGCATRSPSSPGPRCPGSRA